jgi:hypothetical protein
VEGPFGEIHEPGPSRPHQGFREIVGHDSLISACREDGGGVDPRELGGVDHPVILLWQVGPELGRLDHHTQVWGQRHAPPPPNSRGARGESCMCSLARTRWCVQGRPLAFWLLTLGERGGHDDLRGSGCLSVIPYIHGRTELYRAQACLAGAFSFF